MDAEIEVRSPKNLEPGGSEVRPLRASASLTSTCCFTELHFDFSLLHPGSDLCQNSESDILINCVWPSQQFERQSLLTR